MGAPWERPGGKGAFQARPCPSEATQRSRATAALGAIPWELALLMCCYALLYRVLGSFDYFEPVATPVARAAMTAMGIGAFWAHFSRQEPLPGRQPAGTVLLLLVLAACSVSLIPLSEGPLLAVSSAAAASCWPLFYVLLWIILPTRGRDAGRFDEGAFSLGWLVLNAALIAAAPIAGQLVRQVDRGRLSLTALALVIVYTMLVATLLVRGRQRRPESGLRRGGGGAEEPDLDARCAGLAGSRGLTPRESEVLALLARGRSVPYICDSLGISQSTVKGHVKHVYAKLGVDGKQGLIDLVEGGGGQGA